MVTAISTGELDILTGEIPILAGELPVFGRWFFREVPGWRLPGSRGAELLGSSRSLERAGSAWCLQQPWLVGRLCQAQSIWSKIFLGKSWGYNGKKISWEYNELLIHVILIYIITKYSIGETVFVLMKNGGVLHFCPFNQSNEYWGISWNIYIYIYTYTYTTNNLIFGCVKTWNTPRMQMHFLVTWFDQPLGFLQY